LFVSQRSQKYVPIDLENFSKAIASEATQSLRVSKRLLRRQAPRNDSLPEHIFDNRYRYFFYSNGLNGLNGLKGST
jgi:hypothetical protein